MVAGAGGCADVYVDGFSLRDFTYKNDKPQIKPIKPSYGLDYGN